MSKKSFVIVKDGYSIHNHKRISNGENLIKERENNSYLTISEIKDLCLCLKYGEVPNGNYGDLECEVWGIMKSILTYGDDSIHV